MSMHEIEAPTLNRSKYAPPYPPYFIALLALEYRIWIQTPEPNANSLVNISTARCLCWYRNYFSFPGEGINFYNRNLSFL